MTEPVDALQQVLNDLSDCQPVTSAKDVLARLWEQHRLQLTMPDHLRWEEIKAADRQARADSHAATLALAIPYAGAIERCQAQVWSQGRGATAHRCGTKARYVVRRAEHRNEDAGDGRLAVCLIHARDARSRRFHKHWSYEVSATEVVEAEYQPPQIGA